MSHPPLEAFETLVDLVYRGLLNLVDLNLHLQKKTFSLELIHRESGVNLPALELLCK